ncbi:hypothetical protein J1614_005452 [Plenodomus biglobosus]|nr:hypothetical protein J1614_005452 [Plenodomus biglobosus]
MGSVWKAHTGEGGEKERTGEQGEEGEEGEVEPGARSVEERRWGKRVDGGTRDECVICICGNKQVTKLAGSTRDKQAWAHGQEQDVRARGSIRRRGCTIKRSG